jgi:hypothetical protein
MNREQSLVRIQLLALSLFDSSISCDGTKQDSRGVADSAAIRSFPVRVLPGDQINARLIV